MEAVNTTYKHREYTLLALLPVALVIPLIFGVYSSEPLNTAARTSSTLQKNTPYETTHSISLQEIGALRNPNFEDLMLLGFVVDLYKPLITNKNLSFLEMFPELNPEKYLQPILPSTTTPVNVILGNIPLSNVQVLGTITQGLKKWAIITPAGQNGDNIPHTITVGDTVSQSQALVKEIVGDRVVLMTTGEITLNVIGTDGQ